MAKQAFLSRCAKWMRDCFTRKRLPLIAELNEQERRRGQ